MTRASQLTRLRAPSLKLGALMLAAALSGHALAQGAAKPAAAAAKPSTSGFLPPAAADANVIDAIAVVVNDEVITKNEIAAQVRSQEANMKAQNLPLPDPADLRRQVIEMMVSQRAQVQLAKEMGVKVDDTQLDRTLQRIAENQKITVQQLRNEAEKTGVSFAEYREQIRTEIMLNRLREHEVEGKVQVSDAEVDTFLAAEKAAAAERVQVNLSQIMVRIPENASPEQIAARKSIADEVMRQLRTGADFAKMATTYSDSSDALKGGEVGWRDAAAIPPVFAQALGKLKPGQVTPIIRSAVGFHILKLVDRRSAAESQEKAIVQQTRARHILLRVTPTQTAEQAKKKLADLKERLDNKAAKFEELARQFSADGSASKGGDLGWLHPGDTMPEFENAMNALKVGEVSGVVESPVGFHLIEVQERKTEDMTQQKERAAARQALHSRKAEEAAEEWVRQVRDRAYVEYREDR